MRSENKHLAKAILVLVSALLALGGCGFSKPAAVGTGSFGDAAVSKALDSAVPAAAEAQQRGGDNSRGGGGPEEDISDGIISGKVPQEKNQAASDVDSGTDPAASDGDSGTEPAASDGVSSTDQAASDVDSGTDPAASDTDSGTDPAVGDTDFGMAQAVSDTDSRTDQAANNKDTGKERTANDYNSGSSGSRDSIEQASGEASGGQAGEGNNVKEIKNGSSGRDGNEKSSSGKYPQIGWNQFFDNEEQSTPSDRFWDLSDDRSTVQIKGFMGEVLSFDQNWFLLIPEPGAECPFDNGDETYWNKIMIVFVKDGTKLRYTSKPLKLTGRLDVGVKIDESGYKTMFRLYDAKFEEIKE